MSYINLPKHFETGFFKISTTNMSFVLLWQYGKTHLIISLIIFFVLLGFSSISDYRFLILALMWIFLIVPFITAFLYYSYALRPITSLNITEHKITFVNEEILVDMFVYEKSSKQKTGNEGKGEEKDGKDEIGKEPDKRRFVISKSLLRQTRFSGNDIILIFGKTAKEFLVIPYAAFSDQKDIEFVLQKSDLEFNKNW